MSRLGFWLIVSLLALPMAAAEAVQTTVVVVRHAEKQSDGEDPGLTQVGEVRAQALADLLRDSPISTVFATQYRRTALTAAPVIEHHEASLVRVPVTWEGVERHAEALAGRILTDHAGETLLVVGHSNTVPAIVEAFGTWTVESLSDTDYDRLFIINHQSDGQSGLVRARYGRPSAGASHAPVSR